jgi:hypothetical protein
LEKCKYKQNMVNLVHTYIPSTPSTHNFRKYLIGPRFAITGSIELILISVSLTLYLVDQVRARQLPRCICGPSIRAVSYTQDAKGEVKCSIREWDMIGGDIVVSVYCAICVANVTCLIAIRMGVNPSLTQPIDSSFVCLGIPHHSQLGCRHGGRSPTRRCGCRIRRSSWRWATSSKASADSCCGCHVARGAGIFGVSESWRHACR